MANDAATPQERLSELKSLTFGFDDHPLEHFRGMSADEIESHGGIGPKFRQRILGKLAELEAIEVELGIAPPPPPPAAEPAPAPADSAYLEPAARGGGGGLMFLAVLLILALIAVAAFLATHAGGMSEEEQARMTELEEQVEANHATLVSIGGTAVDEAEELALLVYGKTRDGNFGLGREHAIRLQKQLATLQQAEEEAGEVDPTRAGKLSAASRAADLATAALALETPKTQDDVETAVRAAVMAVRALREPGEAPTTGTPRTSP